MTNQNYRRIFPEKQHLCHDYDSAYDRCHHCILAPLSIPTGRCRSLLLISPSICLFTCWIGKKGQSVISFIYCSALPDFLSFPVLPVALPSSPDQPAVT